MQALSGNTNDQKAFAEVASRHVYCLKAAQQSYYFVGDAALYTAESIAALHQPVFCFSRTYDTEGSEAPSHCS